LAGVNLRPNRASDLRRNGASSKCRFRDLEQVSVLAVFGVCRKHRFRAISGVGNLHGTEPIALSQRIS
jgi:hypothetical protein